MEENKKIEMLEEMLDLEGETLSPDTVLSSLEEWDSLAKLSLIVMAEDEFNKKLTGDEVRAFSTVGDILDYLG